MAPLEIYAVILRDKQYKNISSELTPDQNVIADAMQSVIIDERFSDLTAEQLKLAAFLVAFANVSDVRKLKVSVGEKALQIYKKTLEIKNDPHFEDDWSIRIDKADLPKAYAMGLVISDPKFEGATPEQIKIAAFLRAENEKFTGEELKAAMGFNPDDPQPNSGTTKCTIM